MKKDEVLILKPKITKAIILGLVCLTFTIGGILMVQNNHWEGWLCASFFGLGCIICFIQIVPGASQLSLTSEGFVITSLFRSYLTRWSDIKEFTLGYLEKSEAVVFDYEDHHTKNNTGKKIAKFLSGNHGALPDNYGMNVSELILLMNEWRNKYHKQKQTR